MTTATETARTVESKPDACPRCLARLLSRYDERVCPMCGWRRYEEDRRSSAPSPITRATARIARYSGKYEPMRGRVVRYEVGIVKAGGHRVGYKPICPFCGAETVEMSLSGKRRRILEERYACPQDHRFSLLPDKKNGGATWE